MIRHSIIANDIDAVSVFKFSSAQTFGRLAVFTTPQELHSLAH